MGGAWRWGRGEAEMREALDCRTRRPIEVPHAISVLQSPSCRPPESAQRGPAPPSFRRPTNLSSMDAKRSQIDTQLEAIDQYPLQEEELIGV